MSATKDKSSRHTFIFDNFYQIYKKGKENTSNSQSVFKAKANSNSIVTIPGLKTEFQVREHKPVEFVAKKIEIKNIQKELSPDPKKADWAVQNLKKNLTELDHLHKKLRFMLNELEELVSE
jgi:ABC-type Zn uptake system ZnuABC Zn-binding protein ZnuA